MLYTVDTTLLINRQTDTPSFQRDNRNNSIVFKQIFVVTHLINVFNVLILMSNVAPESEI